MKFFKVFVYMIMSSTAMASGMIEFNFTNDIHDNPMSAAIEEIVDITDLDKATVARALFNKANFEDKTLKERYVYNKLTDKYIADEIIDWELNFPLGRLMNVNLLNNSFDAAKYNKNNGEGLAQKIIAELRASQNK